MLAAYFDESGLHADARCFCFAGYIGYASDWFEFSRLWRHALAEARVASFHMSEFETRHGLFADWPRERRYSLIRELVSIINSTDLWGFGIGVPLDVYERVRARLVSQRHLRPEWWDHPYLLAYQWALVELGVESDHLPQTETIAFTLDRTSTFRSRLADTHRTYQKDTTCARHWRIGSLTFRARVDTEPLQAADLLAYEVRKFIDRGLYYPDRPLRQSMNRLLRRVVRIKYFDEAGLLALAESA